MFLLEIKKKKNTFHTWNIDPKNLCNIIVLFNYIPLKDIEFSHTLCGATISLTIIKLRLFNPHK